MSLSTNPGPMREMPRDDIEALRMRCLQRTNGDYAFAERLVLAFLRGREEADQSWRERRAS